MPTAREEKLVDEWRSARRRASLESRLARGGIPVRFRAPLSDLEPRSDQRRQFEELRGYVSWFPDNWRHGTGMTLMGPPGSGKSRLACAVAVELMVVGYVCHYTTLEDYVSLCRREMSLAQMIKNPDTDAVSEWWEVDELKWIYNDATYLLVIDDVGKEYRAASGWAADMFEHLIRHRFDRGLPTLVTTNLRHADWNAEYNPSMFSFLGEACPVLEFS